MAKRMSRADILQQIKSGELSAVRGTELLKEFYLERKRNYDIVYYRTEWLPSELEKIESSALEGTVLIFDSHKKMAKSLKTLLGKEVLHVKPAKHFDKIDGESCELNLERDKDYNKLVELVSEESSVINIIYNRQEEHFPGKVKEVEKGLPGSLYSLLYLTQALMKAKVKAKVRLIFLYSGQGEPAPHFGALSGFAKTLQLENPRYSYRTVALEEGSPEKLAEIAVAELLDDSQLYEVSYRGEKRFVKRYNEIERAVQAGSKGLKEGGVYLLTGGAGGLGLLFANYLAKNYKARLVLTGRSELKGERKKRVERLEEAGVEVLYLAADISKAKDIKRLIKGAKERFGKIDGVLHCAGVNRDSYIMKKTVAEMEDVLAPKLRGTLLLDEALVDEKLDFFVLFSSIAASLGNAGQADYSFANSFLDYYAAYRNSLVKEGSRSGKTLSINWPLWESGGMHVDSQKEELLERSWGMVPLRSKPGLEAFVNGLELETDQLLVVEGDRAKLNEVLGIGPRSFELWLEELIKVTSELLSIDTGDIDAESEWGELGLDTVNQSSLLSRINEYHNADYSLNLLSECFNIKELAQKLCSLSKEVEVVAKSESTTVSVEGGELQEKVEFYLKKLLSELIKLPISRIDSQEPFEKYGIDSILITSLNRKLESDFGELSKTLFFEYQTIEELASYFTLEHGQILPLILNISQQSEEPASPEEEQYEEKMKLYLQNMISSLIKLPPSRIDTSEALEKYGLDSIMITTLNKELEKEFSELSKTLFFEYQTIDELSEYFVQNHRQTLSGLFVGSQEHAREEVKQKESRKSQRTRFKNASGRERAQPHRSLPQESVLSEDIAIIGVSGRYPMAENLEQFWQNLIEGKDCITEIPTDRWDHSLYFNPDKKNLGTTYSKWGGFIKDIDKFDPLFFNISPREAELMDPHMRVFLETAWKTVEDAGYSIKELRNENIGVFAGQMFNYYMLYGADSSVKEKPFVEPASLSNRVSYHLNLSGPSVTVDTMCSSSLTTIHLACQSIRSGDCNMAIAGGVNITDHPNKYLRLAQQNFLASDGRCKSFGIGGDGYVPGEGVGALLLKPLSRAIEDSDHIYAVIKSTFINHGGKVNGYTVPNPNAQAKLIEKAIDRAGIDIKTINYIETHGTGTSLGDPIEITGLTKAFKNKTEEKQFCSIGSVKSNIGHLESAAGVAAVTKVLLQMKYKQLAPSIHSNELNPNINFKDTPFYVQKSLKEWTKVGNNPRRAGVSSFGAGGANAHLILEEYDSGEYSNAVETGEPQIAIFSARNKQSLDGYIKDMILFLKSSRKLGTLPPLTDIAYTLQAHREEMGERLAVVVSSIEDLESTLKKYIDVGPKNLDNLETRNIKSRRRKSDFFIEDEEGEHFVKLVIDKKNYIKLAQMWVHGIKIDWTLLNQGLEQRKISLPTYSFLRKRCWIDVVNMGNASSAEGKVKASSYLHPLVGSNVSTLNEQRFTTRLGGNEFFLNDHLVGSDKVLPGVTYLEMARAAGSLAAEKAVTSIRNVIWARPIIVGESPVDSYISFYPTERETEYEVWSLDEQGERVLNSQGKIGFDSVSNIVPSLEIDKIKQRCEVKKSAEQCYSIFKKMSLNYGPGFQGIQELSFNESEALALLEIPAHLQAESRGFMLPPTIMDGALQAVVGLLIGDKDEISSTFLPFALGEVEIYKELGNRCYAYATAVDGKKSKFEIAISDESGNLLVKLKGFAVREFKQGAQSRAKQVKKNLYYYTSEWQKAPLVETAVELKGTTLIFDSDETLSAPFSKLGKTILVKPGRSFNKLNQESYEIAPESEADYNSLVKELLDSNRTPINIIHCWSQQSVINLPEDLNEQLDSGAYSLFNLTKALLANRLKDKVKVLYLYDRKAENPAFSAMSGFVKTVHQENGKYYYKAIGLDLTKRADFIEALLNEFSQEGDEKDLMYKGRERYRKSFIESMPSTGALDSGLLKKDGVYLITGGTGGLGLLFAGYIAEKVQARLVLTGRSSLNDKKRAEIARIEALGSQVAYIQNDITSHDDVKSLVSRIKDDFGQLNGIIHSAGLLRDSFIFKKSLSDFKAVANPKVLGTAYLDEATKDEALDFFMLFSSISGSTGNPGQCDYSYSNCFMDDFASLREDMRKDGKRSGKTISVNWPLWEEGGMNVDDKTREYLRKSAGMVPLRTAYGLEAFERALLVNSNHLVVVEGDKPVIDKKMKIKQVKAALPQVAVVGKESSLAVGAGEGSLEKVESQLLNICSELLKVEVADIDTDGDFADYGIDSILMMEMMNKIEALYGDTVEPNALSEHSTVKSLAAYLIEEGIIKAAAAPAVVRTVETVEAAAPVSADSNSLEQVESELLNICSELLKVEVADIDSDGDFADYGIDSILMMEMMNKIETLYGDTVEPNALSEHSTVKSLAAYLIEEGIVKAAVKPVPSQIVEDIPAKIEESPSKIEYTVPPRSSRQRGRFAAAALNHLSPGSNLQDRRIAVVSVACRFPQSDSPEAFWTNLKAGRDLVTEVPALRWQIADYFSPDKDEPGKSYSKWAGFIDNIDLFDAAFFGYSDGDALVMDPQHRLLLELSQELLDRGGYSRADISQSATGVFLGGTESSYVEKNMDKISDKEMKHVMVNKIQNMMAARLSDFYDLKGASFTIDTACSSSLVAIHQACQSIINGECSMAIAGGIELILDEIPHVGFSKSGALSDGPHSFVFDERAKGFVLGEGVGLVLLKSFSEAVRDGDQILGTIIGSAVNNDGHTMGLTVPNQKGQKEVIQQAIEKSGITPDTISYLEAHGTGTLLGDPIEIKAAGQVHRQYTEAKQYCAVGAVKSNMGHSLHAAGVAGVIKIIMALQNRFIPPTLHCERPHPRFKFEESPFFPVLTGREWQAHKGVRRAAISSFGFGGTNAHLIIEEAPGDYESRRKPLPPTAFNRKRYWLGEEIVEVGPSIANAEMESYSYEELLMKLSRGELSPDELLELERAGKVDKMRSF